jgi:hypothetical protein
MHINNILTKRFYCLAKIIQVLASTDIIKNILLVNCGVWTSGAPPKPSKTSGKEVGKETCFHGREERHFLVGKFGIVG